MVGGRVAMLCLIHLSRQTVLRGMNGSKDVKEGGSTLWKINPCYCAALLLRTHLIWGQTD